MNAYARHVCENALCVNAAGVNAYTRTYPVCACALTQTMRDRHTNTNTHANTYTYTHIHIRTHTHTYAHTHLHTYTHTYTDSQEVVEPQEAVSESSTNQRNTGVVDDQQHAQHTEHNPADLLTTSERQSIKVYTPIPHICVYTRIV